MGLFPSARLWGGVPAVLQHGCDVEGIMECVVPGRAANQRDEMICRGERKGERCYVYIRHGHLGGSVTDLVSCYWNT